MSGRRIAGERRSLRPFAGTVRRCAPVAACAAAALALATAFAGCGGGEVSSSHAMLRTAPPASVKPFDMGRPDVVLLVTGGNDGMMEVCNCSGPMLGGLSRRSGLVRSYRAAFDHVIAIDTGDLLAVNPKSIRNEYIMRAYAAIGYDAVVPGDREWSDVPRLQTLLSGNRIPCLSTTVGAADEDRLDPRVAPSLTRDWPGVSVGVVSRLRAADMTFATPEQLAALKFDNARLAATIADFRAHKRAVIEVCHGDRSAAEDAALSDGADLVIRGHANKTDVQMERAGGVAIAKIGGFEYVGVIALKIESGKIADMEYRVEAVDAHWPLDPGPMEAYQAYAHHEMRLALDAPRRQGLAYVPSSQCGACHKAQFDSWSKTKHAGAYAKLGDRAADPNCLSCHTTGFGADDGFYTIAATPAMANVNCQDCHRQGADHTRQALKPPPVTEDVCTTCHTPVTDPNWDFQKRLKDVRCPGHGEGNISASGHSQPVTGSTP